MANSVISSKEEIKYSDPTANTAIANVDRELRKQKKQEEQLKKAAAAKAAAAERREETPEILPEKSRELEAAKRYNAWLQLVWPVPDKKEREVA